MELQDIYLIGGTSYRQMTKELLEACELAELISDTEKIIGIKPNLVSATPASLGATTHPEVAAGLIEYLQEHGFQKLRILEGSWVGDRTSEAFEVCGYRELSEKYQVPLLDMQKERGVAVVLGDQKLQICRAVQEIDFLINLPVLKGHCQTKMTCALKNLKGLIPNSEKRRFHVLGLHNPIAALNAAIPQDFILVDNICGDLDSEDGGNPCYMNRLLAGRDPVLMDAYLCREMHLKPEEIPYIPLSAGLGVGSDAVLEARVRWLNPEAQKKLPVSGRLVALQDYVEEVESCSACYSYLIPALDMLRQEGLLDGSAQEHFRKNKICIGQGWRGKGGLIGIGSCTSGFCTYLEGCPPTENQIFEFLKEYLEKGK